MPDARTNARDNRGAPPVTSAPAEDPRGRGEIDYENAQLMPSLPDPPPSDNLPTPPTGDGSMGQPGHTPSGSQGTGDLTPKVLFPPKSLPATDPADDAISEEQKPR